MPTEIYSKRLKRLSQSGQSDVYQYDDFPDAFRVQVAYIWGRINSNSSVYDKISLREFWASVHDTLAEEYGVAILGKGRDAEERCLVFLQNATASEVLDIIDFSFRVIADGFRDFVAEKAIDDLNHRFQEHRIGYEFLEGEIIRKDSQYLHEEAVKPALTVLNGPGFEGPQLEFFEAHAHLRAGEYQDAIVDAGKAFESTMKAICDLQGWTYDPLRATASVLVSIIITNNLIDASMTQQMTSFRTLMESGVPTLRNRNGGHGGGSAPVEVAEYVASYALHLAASNIVFLVEAQKFKQ